MKYEDRLRKLRRLEPDPAAAKRWRRAVFGEPAVPTPRWVPSLVSGLAMLAMLGLLWPAAARGPVGRGPGVGLIGETCDGRWEKSLPLRADVRGLARPQPMRADFRADFRTVERCGLCHTGQTP